MLSLVTWNVDGLCNQHIPLRSAEIAHLILQDLPHVILLQYRNVYLAISKYSIKDFSLQVINVFRMMSYLVIIHLDIVNLLGK